MVISWNDFGLFNYVEHGDDGDFLYTEVKKGCTVTVPGGAMVDVAAGEYLLVDKLGLDLFVLRQEKKVIEKIVEPIKKVKDAVKKKTKKAKKTEAILDKPDDKPSESEEE